jgi:hypothetical protein
MMVASICKLLYVYCEKGGLMKCSHKLDLAAEIPWENMPEKKRREIWDDGVHFTEKGYGLMGRTIAKKLVATIAAEKGWDVVEEGANVDEKVELKRREETVEDTKARTKRKVPLGDRTGQEVRIDGRQLRSGKIVAG